MRSRRDKLYYLLKDASNSHDFSIISTPGVDNEPGNIEAYTIDQSFEKCVSCYNHVLNKPPKDLNLMYKLADIYCMYWAYSVI
jgi:hypothetical protein